MKEKEGFRLILLLLCIVITCLNCKKEITINEVRQTCIQSLSLEGVDTSRTIIYIEPDHPITMDSVTIYKNRISWLDLEVWVKQTRPYLKNNLFWKCTGITPNEMDGVYEVYIDSKSGKVLYIYPLWNNRR